MMWAVSQTYDRYGNLLVGLSKQEQAALQRTSPSNLPHVEDLPSMSDKSIKALVRGGLPEETRIKFWLELSGASILSAGHGIHYYESLQDRTQVAYMLYDAEHAVSKWMPGNRLLTHRMGLVQIAQIVQAYCKHANVQPEENLFVTCAFLVSVIGVDRAEEAFWLMTALFRQVLPTSFSDQEAIGQRGQLQSQVLAVLAEKRIPKLCSALKHTAFRLSTETSAWFSNLFIGILPCHTVVRVWDALLFEGPKVLYRVALALLKGQEKCITQYPSRISNMVWHIGRTFDADLLMKTAFNGIGSFPGEEVRRLEHVCEPMAKKLRTSHAKRLEALLCPAPKPLEKSSMDSLEEEYSPS